MLCTHPMIFVSNLCFLISSTTIGLWSDTNLVLLRLCTENLNHSIACSQTPVEMDVGSSMMSDSPIPVSFIINLRWLFQGSPGPPSGHTRALMIITIPCYPQEWYCEWNWPLVSVLLPVKVALVHLLFVVYTGTENVYGLSRCGREYAILS